jgi:carbon monoxide dehydrogenase subunit G
MAAIRESIEIARRPDEVFAYAVDFSRFPEWQEGIVSIHPDHRAVSLGSKALVVRQAGPRKLAGVEEITELEPPRSWTVRAAGGPVAATARGTVEPIGDGARSRVTIALEFEGHGIGKLLVPLVVRRQARRVLPKNVRNLRELLEREG